MLSTGKKVSPGKGSKGGTAGKAAMLTAAAGFAYKNRSKISAMLGKRGADQQQPSTSSTPPAPPAPPVSSV